MSRSSSVDLAEYEGLDKEIPFDCSDGRGGYVLFTPKGDALRVSASAYCLLRALREDSSMSPANEMSKTNSPERSAHLQIAHFELLRTLDDIQCRSSRRRLPWGFWLRWSLLSQELVSRIASFTSLLYHPIAFVLLASFTLAMVLTVGSDVVNFRIAQSTFVSGYLLFLMSLIVHEFGHVAACARFGARPSDIGFTIYLIYPAFYSNVNSCWKLSRWKRVIVDLGGSYFQLAFGAGLLAGYTVTHWVPLRVAFTMILYATVFCLNPIFKFDGYWVLADALGVPNLSKHSLLITRYLSRRLLGHPTDSLMWSKPIILMLIAYTLASNLVWAEYILRLFPTLVASLHGLYFLAKRMVFSLGAGKIPSVKEFYNFAISGYFSAIVCFVLYRFGLLAKTKLHSKAQTRRCASHVD